MRRRTFVYAFTVLLLISLTLLSVTSFTVKDSLAQSNPTEQQQTINAAFNAAFGPIQTATAQSQANLNTPSQELLASTAQAAFSQLEVGPLASGVTSRFQLAQIWTAELDKPANTLRFSPDGQLLAAGESDGSVEMWNLQTGEKVKTWQANDESVQAVDFSPDGRLLASGGGNPGIGQPSTNLGIKIWDMQTGTLAQTLQGHTNPINSLVDQLS
jgi:WD40 repeat protein